MPKRLASSQVSSQKLLFGAPDGAEALGERAEVGFVKGDAHVWPGRRVRRVSMAG
jgi:hypothetical protein